MSHPFENKLFDFIGEPIRCSRRDAREALAAVGGVTDERISTFTEYAVSFSHDGKSKKYAEAVKRDKINSLILLDEAQFFDILEGKAEPPRKVERDKPERIYANEAHKKRQDNHWNDMLNRKRMNNMAKYGTTMPDGSVVKIDLRPLDVTRRILDLVKSQPEQCGFAITGTPYDSCNICDKPAKVHVRDSEDSDYVKLCQDCYNKMMADYTGTEIPESVPKQLLIKDDGGKSHTFDIEFMIFATGKELTAKEKGKIKRRIQVQGEVNADFEKMLQLLKRKIIKALSTIHIDDRGVIQDGTAEGYIEYNSNREDYDIFIDGKPYTWEDLKKNISMHEGWTIKIEFGDFDDVVE